MFLSQDTCDLMEPADVNGHNKSIAKGKKNPVWESWLTWGLARECLLRQSEKQKIGVQAVDC